MLYTEAASRETDMLSQIHELSSAVRAAQDREERLEARRESEEQEYEAAARAQAQELTDLQV
jgi:hypothetical protein